LSKAITSKRYERFCDLIVEERRRAKLTQAEVARLLRKHQSYVSKYESAERRLDVLEFLEVAEAIGFDPAKLIRKLGR
jgi:transcriptional regulator with XRE-family HTH domain